MRSLTGGMITQLTSGRISPVMFYEALFDSGPVRFWTGYGPLSWDGKTWTGSGAIIQFADIKETIVTRADDATFTLSGNIAALVALALQEPYQGRRITAWIGAMTEDMQIVPDPYPAFTGFMDQQNIQPGGGDRATISVKCENMLIALERANERKYTNADQKSEYPDDDGFEPVPWLQDAEVIWNQPQG